MTQKLLDSTDTSELHGPEVQRQTGSLSSLNEANDRSSHFASIAEESNRDLKQLFWEIVAHYKSQNFVSNFKALGSRFIQLSHRPEHLAPLILDFWTLPLSIIWSGRQSGTDLLYPLSSLKKHKPGRLARQLLEHSRVLQQRDLHVATSPMEGIDPPRVAVIDLGEVPREIVERGYTVPGDFYGIVVMILFLEALITLLVQIFSPVDGSLISNWLGDWVAYCFNDSFGTRVGYMAGILFGAAFNWTIGFSLIVLLWIYASLRGEVTITLLRRSDISTPGCAVLLDRDFTVVLRGAQNVVEAIAESCFRISHLVPWRHRLEGWQFCQWFCYEALKASCQGAPFAMLAGLWLLLSPTSLLTAFMPLVPTAVVSFATLSTGTIRSVDRIDQQQELDSTKFLKTRVITAIRFIFSIAPTFLLISIYELAVAKDPLLRGLVQPQPTIWLQLIPNILLIILFLSSRNYNIRTAKLLNILGHPPVRRWAFDTLAAAVTFQCLVLCHGIPRPIKSIDLLTLLDTLIPDQREVWRVWKERVADRIAHEVDISFAPTLPSFGDQRQKRLKELLDQAQLGYDVYARFYDQHVPLHSTITL